MKNVQEIILRGLIKNEKYCRKSLPHLKKEYFEDHYLSAYSLILSFIAKNNKLPTTEVLEIEFQDSQFIKHSNSNEVLSTIRTLDEREEIDYDWLLEKTESWCKDRAINNAILKGWDILHGKDQKSDTGAILDIMADALKVSFDNNVGHDYFVDIKNRFDAYHTTEEKIPFDIDLLNQITKNGLPKKTLNIIMAGTGVGKSLALCHFAASNLNIGKNVLYITMEMAEERIAERIDANLLDVPIDQIENLSYDIYKKKVEDLKKRSQGKLIIKEYPTAAAHVGHFRALLDELKMKKDFKPDVVYIDYLNICASSRMKGLGGSVNTYSYIKAIAEELRGLAVEFAVPIWSATQTTRGGFGNSDVELTDTSESFGLPATSDLFLALISTDTLEEMGQIMVKQLKNRYNDVSKNKKFVIGIDRSKMRLYDLEASAQTLTDGVKENDFEGFKI